MKNQVQLITYIDRIGGGISDFAALLAGPLKGLFGGVHLLPFFHPIDGADAGFDPIDHTLIDHRVGSWDDLRRLSNSVELMADLIVNHISAQSPQFQDFLIHGSESEYANLFLTFERVFPDGAMESELSAIYRPRPGLPFTPTTLSSGQKRLMWTTFTQQQIDIDLFSEKGREYIDAILHRFRSAGIRALRLDAVGYAVKKRGTSCFMIPETYDLIRSISALAAAMGMEVLVEIHSYYKQQVAIAKLIDWVYDFALPPLVLHAIFEADVKPLYEWMLIRPKNAFTVLDTHDGIGVIDVGADANGNPGLLHPEQINRLVNAIHVRSKGESKQATGAAANNLDLYQVNCTYFDALGRNEALYLIARAIQFFCPGIPQVYYVGLFGGTNDMQLLARTGVGRDINRHYFTRAEIESAMRAPMVERLTELIRLRNTHPAFDGEFQVQSNAVDQIEFAWSKASARIRLQVELEEPRALIEYTDSTHGTKTIVISDQVKVHGE